MNEDYGHRPMLVSVAHSWVPYAHTRTTAIGFKQRLHLRQQQLERTEARDSLQSNSHDSLLALGALNNSAGINDIHDAIRPDVHDAIRTLPPEVVFPSMMVACYRNKRLHFRAMRNLTSKSMRVLFSGWFHAMRFCKLKKQHLQHAKDLRKQKAQALITQADALAKHHDAKGLFGLINRFTPKSSMQKIRLKTLSGQLATAHEEIDMYHEYINNTWAGPSRLFPHEPC